MSLVRELKRRNVFRVAAAYLAGAWLIIEVSSTLFDGFGVPGWAFRFVVIVLALGFIPALLISWTYEVTSEGLKREKDIVREDSRSHVTAKRLDLWTIALVIIAILFVAVDRVWLSDGAAPLPAATEMPTSIAVLPFANRSADPNDAFFVDGIHDDLLTYIARTGDLKTISRTSVMQYRDSDKPIPQIAAELGVTSILEGGVQRAGDQVRINVQLIDARTDDHLWAEIYDRQLTAANIFSIQSEIAGMIAEALHANLTPAGQQRADQAPTDSLAALEAYYLGRQQTEKRSGVALEAAVRHFSTAVELDPNFALAYVGLADTYRLQSNYARVPVSETEPKIEAAVERALQLDPLLGEAHASLANLRVWRGDYQGAEEAYQRAIELNPNYAPAYQWYGERLGGMGRIEEALELSRKSVELDPLSPIIRVDYAESFEHAGQTDNALTQYLKALEIDPDFVVAHRQVALLYWQRLGRLEEAATHFIKAVSLETRAVNSLFLALIFSDLGDEQQADNWLDHARTIDNDYWLTKAIWAMVETYRGNQAAAAALAQEAIELQPLDNYSHRILRDRDLAIGDLTATRARYAAAYPELFDEGGPRIRELNMMAAVDLAYALQALGETERVEQLLTAVESYQANNRIWDGPVRGTSVALVRLLRGDKDAALAELRNVIDAGWREDWRFFLELDPALRVVRDDARFEALLDDIRTDMDEQLANFNAREDGQPTSN